MSRNLYIFFWLSSFVVAEELLLPPASQVIAAYIQGDGIGYQHGYSTAALFITSELSKEGYLFFDERVHILNSGKVAFNLGMGGRGILKDQNACLGANGFLDYRDAYDSFQRIGLGVDAYMNRFFFASNGYFILSHISQITEMDTVQFPGGYIISTVFDEESFKYGWDAEIGRFMIDQPNFQVYLAPGTYYLKNRNKLADQQDIWGVKVRAFIQLKEVCKLEFFFSDDSYFHKKFQGQISITIPFLKKKNSGKYLPVVRQEIIPITHNSYWQWNW